VSHLNFGFRRRTCTPQTPGAELPRGGDFGHGKSGRQSVSQNLQTLPS
jgi:hypothetical protein